MEIKVIKSRQLKEKPADESSLGFGEIFTDHMFLIDYDTQRGWHNARIEPYHPLELDPAAVSLHYGQEIFEGLKAYRGKDDSIYLFRAIDNCKGYENKREFDTNRYASRVESKHTWRNQFEKGTER